MNKKNISVILSSLLSGTDNVSRTMDGPNMFFVSSYQFNIDKLSSVEVEFLKKVLTGTVKDSIFYHWVADVNESPILFMTESDARDTVRAQMKHIEKRFLFSVFQETGIIYEKPKTTNVKFFKK